MIAPTDATDPPTGWSWAKKDIATMNTRTGECTYLVSQDTPAGFRRSEHITNADAMRLMVEWNEQAKRESA